jgi:formylmethanofuran dehydrogenase subunit E
MSDISLNQYSRLSDSLERELMRAAATGNESVSVVDLGKDALSMLKRAAYNFAMYLVEVSRALDEARAKDARFSRSHW